MCHGFNSCLLYTSGSTTGAQLLPFEVGEKREGFEVFKDGIAISGARKNDIYAVGRSGMDNESSYDDFQMCIRDRYDNISKICNIPIGRKDFYGYRRKTIYLYNSYMILEGHAIV